MNKHSPIPWKAVKRPGKPSWHIVADDGFILATIHYRQRAGGNGFLPSEAEPNAHLIVEASETKEQRDALLEAMKKIANDAEYARTGIDGRQEAMAAFEDIVVIAEAAIAQALGE